MERLAIGRGIAAPLIGALVAATGDLPVDAVAEVVADRDAMLRGAMQHTVVQLIEDTIDAEYDASRSKSNSIHPNDRGGTP